MKKTLFTLILMALVGQLSAQTLFTVGEKAVSVDEFLYVYGKNKDIGNQIDPKTPEEYLGLYIAFKRKVAEAESLGRDTIPSFLTEYNTYYRQLLKPYLTDKSVDDEIVREAYDRMSTDIRAAHIMLDLPENALPEDTAKVYKQILAIRDRLNRGESFETIARQQSSDSYSAVNGGDLGYFTVFSMVYPFENACYNAEIGKVVGPVRTQYGYHLIKVLNKRPARYRMTAAHILLLDTEDRPNPEAAKKIQDLYKSLQAGEDFNALARKHSQDQSSLQRGGQLPAFGLNQMLPEFEDAAFGLAADGDFSEPFQTKLGWHIVKRVSREDVPAFERMQGELAGKIRRDERSNASMQAFLASLSERYQVTIDESAVNQVLKALEKGKSTAKLTKPVVTYESMKVGLGGTKTISQTEFAARAIDAEARRLTSLNEPSENVKKVDPAQAYGVLQPMIHAALMAEAEYRLPFENATFRFLAQEYREGILVFDLTREKVWDAASQDSAQLAIFFAAFQDQYQWNNRYTGTVFTTSSEKVAKKAADQLRRGVPAEKVARVLNAKDPLALAAQDYTALESGNNTLNNKQKLLVDITGDSGEKVSGPLAFEDGFAVVVVTETLPAGPKALSECRGQVITDLQKALEAQWLDYLGGTYPLNLDQAAWQAIQSKL
ncbi:peptidylprolyl isomerase [Schleiferiaceae bacterium]|nr:peptidylprolyl isomerase [Schleiferiaceae bacterium]